MVRACVLVVAVACACWCAHASSHTFFWLSDAHLDQDVSCLRGSASGSSSSGGGGGSFGDYYCDSPEVLVDECIAFLQTLGTPEFVVWSGNTGSHAATSEDDVLKAISTVTTKLTAAFPSVPLVPCLGGFDVYPSFQMAEGPGFSLFDSLAQTWTAVLPTSAATTFQKGGYYAVSVSSTLTLIVLNTVYYSPQNALVTDDDPADQFAWLQLQLKELRSAGTQAFIVASIPVGGDEINGTENFAPKFNQRLLDIIATFPDVISGQLYGHEHTDSFRVFYNSVSDLPEQARSHRAVKLN
eukprot:TRINITY_DN2928_c0_g1_i1.p1 TRINITY_DN2928_c0_g1~~TRINITY_DN2928_c0_g1_i1.p1  ORF type:complete len:308 (-),score=65.08 TRINITY_DN2928_c0_g1_i1:608-1498(-)